MKEYIVRVRKEDDVPFIKIEYMEELVRCKDCKHRYVDGTQVRFNVCELTHNRVQGDEWFCADGEKVTES